MIDYEYSSLCLKFEQKFVTVYNIEPSRFVHYDSGKIMLIEDAGFEWEIGSFKTIRLDIKSAINEDESADAVFDSSDVTYSYYKFLYDRKFTDFNSKVQKYALKEATWNPNLLIIDRITIDKEHRGKGYGLEAIEGLIKSLGIGINVVALKPFPLQFEGSFVEERDPDDLFELGLNELEKNQNKATKKLINLYSKLGFILIPRTPLMVLSLENNLTNS